ncbi:MAG: VOC family protein [Cyclobacteriaceae bacterium]|nr:VOC family protein [Cyclobacteriaceae bacterium]
MNEKMSAQTNAINWFEIPVTDMPRAKAFYEAIFEIKMEEMDMPDLKYAMFPFSPTAAKVSGGLAKSAIHKPGASGSLVYLNANPDLQLVLNRIEKAGGKITMPKTSIGQNGFMAVFSDTEGNAIALHSNG